MQMRGLLKELSHHWPFCEKAPAILTSSSRLYIVEMSTPKQHTEYIIMCMHAECGCTYKWPLVYIC